MPIISTNEFLSSTFDYLIVGGGTAGLAVAARLSENPSVVVGVIEAGEYDPNVPEINIPGLTGRLIANPKYDWTFFSTPQERANNRVVLQPRGKALGGSSMLNFMIMCRPSKEEFDVLEEFGNKGWNWDSLLECMKKSETLVAPKLSPADAEKYAASPEAPFHGTHGPIQKNFTLIWNALHLPLFDAMETLGVQRNPETGGGHTVGTMAPFHSIDPKTATRSYAATGYYEPNKTRSNLLVLLGAQVTRVLLESGGDGLQKAVGVEFVKDGVTTSIKGIKKEVVLSAGSFGTPQLLELSGIGNKDHLAKHGIKSVIDLPGVGENLQDHVMIPTIAEIDSKHETADILSDPAHLAKHQELYKQQTGFLATFPGAAFAFVPAHALGSDEDVRAWQEKSNTESNVTISEKTPPELKKGLEKQYEVLKRWFDDKNIAQGEILNFSAHFPLPNLPPVPGKVYTTLLFELLHPLSRGSVHIGSGDPLAPPVINPNYFAHSADLDLLAQLLKFTLRIHETAPFNDAHSAYVIPTPAQVQEMTQGGATSDEALKAYIREWVMPVWHPVGTAAMVPRDEGGVVDDELKVYGTSNLRVADLSVLPMELTCHTQTAAYAIGEKAAEIFKRIA